MRSFDEIISNGVVRWTEREKECLIDHIPDEQNGAFKIGELLIIATTEHLKGEIFEHVSVSLPGIIKPDQEDIELIKELFWKAEEIQEVRRLYVPSQVIHLNRKKVVHMV